MTTATRTTRNVNAPAATLLTIALPAGIDAATVSEQGESTSKALLAVVRQGREQFIERAAAAVQIATPSTALINERIGEQRTINRIVDETKCYSMP